MRPHRVDHAMIEPLRRLFRFAFPADTADVLLARGRDRAAAPSPDIRERISAAVGRTGRSALPLAAEALLGPDPARRVAGLFVVSELSARRERLDARVLAALEATRMDVLDTTAPAILSALRRMALDLEQLEVASARTPAVAFDRPLPGSLLEDDPRAAWRGVR